MVAGGEEGRVANVRFTSRSWTRLPREISEKNLFRLFTEKWEMEPF